MNTFTKKTVGTLTLGEKLKKLRSERRMSLGEASRNTRIQKKYLEFLEEGQYSNLPADVYVRGFLRSYADFLGVDEKILVKLYEKENEIKKNLEKRENSGKKKPPTAGKTIDVSSFVFTPKLITIGLLILLVSGGIFYLYKEIGSFASTPRLVILGPENNYATEGNSITVEGITDRDARVFLNGQPILVADDGKFRESVSLQSGTNSINLKSVNKFNKEISENLTVQSNYQSVQEGPEDQSVGQSGNISDQQDGMDMEIRVDPGPVWVSVEADGNLVFSGTMLEGSVQSFQAKNKIIINSGKGNATFIKFNGKDIGSLGENEKAIRGATFTQH
ncbi:MAG TPA: hypothetical protein DIT25_03810 [Candidatus Moranbacteria bacterium]|nr:hypothetical protein [Candidatus Moranbacteria bacterium]